MATGKELVRLTECGYWFKFIGSDVDYYRFYDSNDKRISKQSCSEMHFCSLKITLKDKRWSEKYVRLLSVFCAHIASHAGERMYANINKQKGRVVIKIN